MERRGGTKSLQEILLETLSLGEILLHLFKSKLRYGLWPMYFMWPHEDQIVRTSLNIIDFASRCGNVNFVETMLCLTSLLNSSHQEKNTVLHYASHLGSMHLVETIIRTGADINVQNEKGDTALHFVSERGQEKIVKLLIKNGARLNVQNNKGCSALMLATKNETSACVNELIRAGSNVNLHNNLGQTALYAACLYKDTDKVTTLMRAGADVNIGRGDNTPLFALMPIYDDSLYFPPTINSRNVFYSQDYHQEADKIGGLLFDADVDVTRKDEQGYSALHRAIFFKGSTKLIEKLLEIGVNVNEQNNYGETALHCACMSNERQTVRVLKDAGADINMQSNKGNTALHYAAAFGSKETVNELIGYGIEINTQNKLGETALHYSLCNIKVFEALLINQALVDVKDTKGHDPMWYMNTADAVLHILKLQLYLKSYRDENGNTIFHIFVKQCWAISRKEIWSFIRTNRKEFSNYLQVQNIFGQTPLHIAASQNQKALDLLFSTFDASLQGILLADEYGNTFLHTLLHTYFSSQIFFGTPTEELEISFVKHLMENDYHNCSNVKKKDLIQSRNRDGNTPLHLVFLNALDHFNEKYIKSLFEILLNAGANINSKNSMGETVLHLLMFSFETLHGFGYSAVARSSEVNVLNVSEDSGIFNVTSDKGFHTSSSICKMDFLTFLKHSGCNMKNRNRIGQTALMSSFTEISRNISGIMKVFDDKEIINIHDDFGSSILHYIAWTEEIECRINTFWDCLDIEVFLHCRVVADELGQLPCDVAYSRGHANILSQVCVCKNGVHLRSPVYYHKRLLFNSLQQKDQSFVNCVQKLSKYCSEDNIENITNVPFLGLVSVQKEANEVQTAIISFINDICKRLGERDVLLKNTVNLSGSVAENTKVGLPDEFDFLCILEKMSELLYIEECNGDQINLRLQEQYIVDAFGRFFNDDLSLSTSKIIERIFEILSEILRKPDIYTNPNLFRVQYRFKRPASSPNFKLKLRWSCCRYKNMIVKIDIVPAFKIHCHRDAKFYTDRFNHTTNKSDLVMIIFKGEDIFLDKINNKKVTIYNYMCKISASNEEMQLFGALSSQARDAYVVSKILCNCRICPTVLGADADDKHRKFIHYRSIPNPCSLIISSYMLKNCLFYVAEEKGSNSQLSVHGYVCEIFQKLLQFTNQEVFPCFMFPCKDLFEYHDGHKSKQTSMVRAMYIKMILNILGKNYDFDDISKDITNQIGTLPGSNFIQDNDICAYCKRSRFKDGVILKACSRCNVWTYCSDECKKRNFKRHKPACDYHFDYSVSVSNEDMTSVSRR